MFDYEKCDHVSARDLTELMRGYSVKMGSLEVAPTNDAVYNIVNTTFEANKKFSISNGCWVHVVLQLSNFNSTYTTATLSLGEDTDDEVYPYAFVSGSSLVSSLSVDATDCDKVFMEIRYGSLGNYYFNPVKTFYNFDNPNTDMWNIVKAQDKIYDLKKDQIGIIKKDKGAWIKLFNSNIGTFAYSDCLDLYLYGYWTDSNNNIISDSSVVKGNESFFYPESPIRGRINGTNYCYIKYPKSYASTSWVNIESSSTGKRKISEYANEEQTDLSINYASSILYTNGTYYNGNVFSKGSNINNRNLDTSSFTQSQMANTCLYLNITKDGDLEDYPITKTKEELEYLGVYNCTTVYGKLVNNSTALDFTNFYRNEGLIGDTEIPWNVIGENADYLYFLSTNGRNQEDRGLTIDEVASLCISLGMTKSYYMDGGGSANFTYNGIKFNQNDDDSGLTERYISVSLNFRKTPKSTTKALHYNFNKAISYKNDNLYRYVTTLNRQQGLYKTPFDINLDSTNVRIWEDWKTDRSEVHYRFYGTEADGNVDPNPYAWCPTNDSSWDLAVVDIVKVYNGGYIRITKRSTGETWVKTWTSGGSTLSEWHRGCSVQSADYVTTSLNDYRASSTSYYAMADGGTLVYNPFTKMATMHFQINTTTGSTNWETVATLPTGVRPVLQQNIQGSTMGTDASYTHGYKITFSTSGNIMIKKASASDTAAVEVSITYLIA